MRRKKDNFMDYIPVCNPDYSWDADQAGRITVHVKNKGFYNRMAQKFFKRPPVSHIALDEYGSFVWQQMDGERSVYEISKRISARYGEAAEPVVPRLVKYIETLYQNKFIGYVKKVNEEDHG